MNKPNEEKQKDQDVQKDVNAEKVDQALQSDVKKTQSPRGKRKGAPASSDRVAANKDGKNRNGTQKPQGGEPQVETPEMIEKVVSINRITKVTKGGKKLSFSALVVVGDTKGNVGYSLSKAKEVAIAIKKAMGVAKRNMIKVPMKGTTITHEIIGGCSGARVHHF